MGGKSRSLNGVRIPPPAFPLYPHTHKHWFTMSLISVDSIKCFHCCHYKCTYKMSDKSFIKFIFQKKKKYTYKHTHIIICCIHSRWTNETTDEQWNVILKASNLKTNETSKSSNLGIFLFSQTTQTVQTVQTVRQIWNIDVVETDDDWECSRFFPVGGMHLQTFTHLSQTNRVKEACPMSTRMLAILIQWLKAFRTVVKWPK